MAIITIYYFLAYQIAYQPDLDPFRGSDGTVDPDQEIQFQPNPVDELVLEFLVKFWKRSRGDS